MSRLCKIALVIGLFLFSSAVLPTKILAYDLEALKQDLQFLITQTPVDAALLFNVFGSNPDPNFQKHRLSDFQLNQLCDGDCGAAGIGVNYATFYKGGNYEKARQFNMQWTLEIARASTSPQTIADIINNEQVDGVIVRIGTGQGSEGFDDPAAYANFLRAIAGLANKPFYAIAGPNEPDIEHWAAPACGAPNQSSSNSERAQFYDCVGPKLAAYMNSLIGAGLPSNVRLLSPAFNFTSFTFNDTTTRPDGIPRAMMRAGANFAALYAVSGNIYPAGDTMQNIWTNHVAGVIGELGKNVIITETGPWISISDLYAGYDTSLYDAYNADKLEFYVHPILGLSRDQGSGGAFDANVKTIRDDLINQGYEARCATPGFKIGLTQNGKDWMADYVEQYWPGAVFGGNENYYIRTRVSGPPGIGDYVRSWLAVDYREVQTPVFRYVADRRFLTTSLEEYFGFKDTVIQENSLSELNSAAINSLLTNQQRCESSVKILIKQEEMCNKLVSPLSCALYQRPVPQTAYTIKTMLDAYKNAFGNPPTTIDPDDLQGGYKDPKSITAICKELVGTDWDPEVREGLLYTPLTIDRAYRLAFLVTTIELKHPTYSSMFNFYIHPNEGPVGGPSAPDDAVLVNAFKVPDILTTTQDDTTSLTTSGNTPWFDSSKLTRNSLITRKQQDLYTASASAKKAELAAAANWYDTRSQTKSDEIYCAVGPSNRGIGSPECKDELAKSVIDIINAQTSNRVTDLNEIDASCPDLNKESAESILDFGSFGPVESIKNPPEYLLYTQQFGERLLQNIFEVPDPGQDPTGELDASHQIEPKGDSHPSFAETWKPGDPDNGENPLGRPRDWGLKSLFHVTDRTYPDFPYNGCCDEREVRHFLVYPMDFDLNTVQEVLAGTFFTTDQIATLAETAAEYDRIVVSGDDVSFTGGTRNHTFSDSRIQPPNWNGQPGMILNGQQGGIDVSTCQEVKTRTCERYDPLGNCVEWDERLIGWNLPCERTFGWEIEQVGPQLATGLVGARLGYWLREVQKNLNTKMGAARDYLDTCLTTEQFLTGQCGQPVIPLPVNNQVDPNCTALSCNPPAPPPTAAPVTPGPTPVASGSCLEISVRNGQVWAKNKCECAFGDWQIRDAAGSLWCGPLGGGNTLFPFEEKGGFCSDRTPPNPVCGYIFAPGGSPGNCLAANEEVCVSW